VRVCACVCVHVCVHVRVHVRVHVCVYAWVWGESVHVGARVCVCGGYELRWIALPSLLSLPSTCVCVYVYVSVCVCVLRGYESTS
jgi:hypothetical protein